MTQDLVPITEYPGIVSFDNAFTDVEVNLINELSLSFPLQEGVTRGDASEIPQVLTHDTKRMCGVKWMTQNLQTQWLFNKLMEGMFDVNFRFFNLELIALEALQYTIYNPPGDTYGVHIDHIGAMGGSLHRKLSFTIQLSDSSEYEGGDLKLYHTTINNPRIATKKKGSITFFYSHILHEVTPVTGGTRKSLVGWFSGPPLK